MPETSGSCHVCLSLSLILISMGVHSVADVLNVSFIQPSTVCANTGKSGGSQSEPDQNKLQVQDEESDSQKPGTRRKPLRHEKKKRV